MDIYVKTDLRKFLKKIVDPIMGFQQNLSINNSHHHMIKSNCPQIKCITLYSTKFIDYSIQTLSGYVNLSLIQFLTHLPRKTIPTGECRKWRCWTRYLKLAVFKIANISNSGKCVRTEDLRVKRWHIWLSKLFHRQQTSFPCSKIMGSAFRRCLAETLR